MKKLLAFVSVLGLIGAGVALAQSYPPPTLSTLNSGTDLMQVIPNGNPSVGNKYATVSTVRGGFSVPLRLLDFKNSDGTTLAASAASGKFGLTISAGTSENLLTEAANSNTKTDVASYEVVLPASYIAGNNITVTANTQYTLGSGTVGTHTLAAAAYATAAAGTQGSTLIATAAQSVPAAAGNAVFTITGTGLTAGSRLFLTFTLVIQDTGASNITAQVNSVTLS